MTDRNARLSLLAVLATSLSTTVHHWERMGPRSLLLGLAVLGLPVVLWLVARRTRSRLARAAYVAVSAWIVIGFGLYDGMWRSTLKLFLGNYFLVKYSQYFSWDRIGSFPFEATGILASIAGVFALVYTARAVGVRVWQAAALALSVTAALVSTSRPRAPRPGEDGVVRIGVIVPSTGPAALLGSSFLKAVQLAKEDLGPTRYRYELVLADTGTNEVQTRRAIQKLISADRVQAIVGGISLPGGVIKPYATYAGIPHLCVCSVRSIGDGVYNFTNIPLAQDEAERWVEEARRRGVRKLAVISQDYPSIDGHVRALKEEARRQGIELTYVNRFAGGTTDFRAIVHEARTSAPDLYFVEATEPSLDALGEQLREAGIRDVSSVVALSLSDQPALFEGAWYTDSWVDPAFVARFEAKYPETRFATHMMPYAYDSLKLVVEAFESGQDPAAYIRSKTTYDGNAGRVTREPGSGNYRSRPAVWSITNGKPAMERS
jgi:ABC-type branched-subunit amino acid transport system substrate-binding protein